MEIESADGTRIDMHWFSGWFVEITVPPDRAARLVGMLGNGDDDLANDLRLPDVTTLDTPDVSEPESGFELSWAVDDSTSLFDYEPGESTATFRIAHPDPDPPPPPPDVVDTCRVALDERATTAEIDACAFDVAVTGDAGFVDVYTTVVLDRIETSSVPGPIVVPPSEPDEPTDPGSTVRAGEPVLTLSGADLDGVVAATAGTVLLVRATECPLDLIVDVEVTPVGSDELAVSRLCDPSELSRVGLDDDDEWVDGEAYMWTPGDGDYEVLLSPLAVDADVLGFVDVYADPTPTIVLADELGDGDRQTLTGLADTIVYLPDARLEHETDGLNVACSNEVWWGDEFPRAEPFDLGVCEHLERFDFPPTDMTIPIVVFNRTDGTVDVEISPAAG